MTALPHRLKTWGSGVLVVGAIATAALTWADSRWNQSDDIGEIRDNVAFLTALTLKDRITRLDGRIQVLESAPYNRDDRQTLNELRLERNRLQRRLEKLDR